MRRFVRDNSMSIVFLALFLAALGGQAIAGHAAFIEQQLAHGGPEISTGRYLLSSSFAVDVMENWQSEYLQFTLFILLTVWLLQKGSPESKELDKAGGESAADQKLGQHSSAQSPAWARASGWRRIVYSNSLVAVMGFIWVCSWLGQSLTGWTEYSDQRIEHLQTPLTWVGYLGSADFWERTFQNWQSEFLAVAS